MSTLTQLRPRQEVIYPESDGQPIAENTLQFRWIVTIEGGLEGLFRDDDNVFVAGDLLWYPVEGDNTIRVAPDILVAFGRPKGDRGSYQQWRENNIAPQVVFEVLSPGNRFAPMLQKFLFYQHYGVEEYYLYDPDDGHLSGWRRVGNTLQEIPTMSGWTSPLLGIRFELDQGELRIFGPDGQRFATFVELVEQREKAQQEKEKERQEKEKERQDKEKEQARVARLTAQLRALGVEPEV